MTKLFGLLGTVTHDVISSASGDTHAGLGGVLYQAAVLCSLGAKVSLRTNLGEDLETDARRIMEQWRNLDTRGVCRVSSPANRVRLHYPERGERVEILESVVPPLDAKGIIDDLSEWDLIVMVFNSGFDIAFEGWRQIVRAAHCPVWLDVHSLALSKDVGRPRKYVSLHDWRDWIENVSYVQANRMELSCMLGRPGREPSEVEMYDFALKAFSIGVKAVFITLGREGVQVMTPAGSCRLSFLDEVRVVDTTGCGDVFCAAAAFELMRDADAFEAARSGVRLSAMAAGVRGIEETYALVSRCGNLSRSEMA